MNDDLTYPQPACRLITAGELEDLAALRKTLARRVQALEAENRQLRAQLQELSELAWEVTWEYQRAQEALDAEVEDTP